jgi:hypothetical protein
MLILIFCFSVSISCFLYSRCRAFPILEVSGWNLGVETEIFRRLILE